MGGKKYYEPVVEDATEKQKSEAKKGKVVFLENGTREGWSGELPFYLFYCTKCKTFSVDYSHSWPESRYVTCQNEACRLNIHF